MPGLHKVKNAKAQHKRVHEKRKKLERKLERLQKKEQRLRRFLGKKNNESVADARLQVNLTTSSGTRLVDMVPVSEVIDNV
jgi:chromosome segregation ATPase